MSDFVDWVFDPLPPYVSKAPVRGPWRRMIVLKTATSFAILQWFAWPVRPRTATAWLIVLAVLVPIAWLRWRFPNPWLHNPLGDRIQARNAHLKHSGERMAYLMFVLVAICAVFGLAVWLGPSAVRFIGPDLPQFLSQHFH